jgi:putative ABC transport system permease protein
MNLAVRDIRYHLGRFVLTSVGLGLLLGVVMAMSGIFRGLTADALSILHATGADFWVVEQGTSGPFAASSRIPEDVRYRIAAVPGIAEASALSCQTIQIDRNGKAFRFFLVGHDLGGLGGPPSIAAGRGIRQKRYEMVAAKGMGLLPGDTLRLGRHDYTVVGTTGKIVSSAGDPVAYVSLADAQEIQFKGGDDAIRNSRARISAGVDRMAGLSAAQAGRLREGIEANALSTRTVNAVVARLAPGASSTDVQGRIERWNHYRAISNEEQTAIIGKGMIEKSKMQLGLFRAILLVISTVIISLIIYTSTLDKVRVIATLKLIGARSRVIVSMILQQSLAMGAIAYVVGYLFILMTYERFPRRIVLEPSDLGTLAAIVTVICVAASVVGIRKALRIEPAEALGG